MPNFVQEYRSTDVGMPTLPGTPIGSLITLLDAVLVNGGATQTVTSLTQSGTTVTAVIPADISLENLDWLVIAGASPAGANGTVQIAFIDSTHFSYQAAAGLGTITGSITYRRAPLGWTKPYSNVGAQLAAYRMAAVGSFPQHYLRVQDDGGTAGAQKESLVKSYENMTDVNTGTGPFPTSTGFCWRRSATADATVRPWSIIGDGATFYFIPNSDASLVAGRLPVGFGAFNSFRPADAFPTFLSGTSTFNAPAPTGGNCGIGFAYITNALTMQQGIALCRNSSQAGGAIGATFTHRWSMGTGVMGAAAVAGGGFVTYPSPVDGALWVEAPLMLETISAPRGRMRGLYGHAHGGVAAANPFPADYDIAQNIAQLPGVTLISYLTSIGGAAGSLQFDRYGPW